MGQEPHENFHHWELSSKSLAWRLGTRLNQCVQMLVDVGVYTTFPIASTYDLSERNGTSNYHGPWRGYYTKYHSAMKALPGDECTMQNNSNIGPAIWYRHWRHRLDSMITYLQPLRTIRRSYQYRRKISYRNILILKSKGMMISQF